jgi:hypothetical protein
MKRITLGLLLLFCFNLSYGLDEHELPFGAYDLDTGGTGLSFEQHLHNLHDSLGFNIFWENDFISIPQIREFGDSGLVVIRAYTTSTDSFAVYSNYNYAKIEAEEYESKVRMYGGSENCNGGEITDSCWVAYENQAGAILFGPDGFNPPCWWWPPGDNIKYYLKLERNYPKSALPEDQDSTITYNVDIRAMIDSIGPDDPVCTLKVTCQPWDGVALQDSIPLILTVSNFNAVDTWQVFSFDFTIPETLIYISGGDTISEAASNTGVKVKIVSSGERTLRVDWIKIYDQTGYDLVETDIYTDRISNFVPQFADLEDTLWGWYFRDEPYYINIPVMGAILNTARAYGNSDWRAITCINYPQYYSYWFEQIDMDLFTPDIYPFSYAFGSDSVAYTGYDDPGDKTNLYYFNAGSKKTQNRLDSFADKCSQAYSAARENGADYWIVLQCFGGGPQKKGYVNWRKSTGPELRCITFMSLAEGARGLIYWKFGVTCGGGIEGMLDCSGSRTDLWYAVKNDINPYIKAIDSVFMGLEFQKSYTVQAEPYQKSHPDRWINSISAVSDSPAPNPDLGWFHVGEFTDTANDKYVMIVNRACSQGPENPAAAPPVIATIDFKTMNLRMGNYVEIIDLATGTNASDWIGTPHSTRVESIRGAITYTTQFGPGEGRLFKLIRAP